MMGRFGHLCNPVDAMSTTTTWEHLRT